MAKKKAPSPATVVNRRARYDYALEDELTAGIVLTGLEVRAARDGRVHLKGAFVTIRGDELWLNNASFSLVHAGNEATVDTTARKLLAHRKQIDTLARAKKDGLSIVPIKLLTGGRHIKVVIATGKGKKRYDKRQDIKKRDLERERR